MKSLNLTGKTGVSVFVDDSDFDGLAQIKWWAVKTPRGKYAYGRLPGGRVVAMHRWLLCPAPGLTVDHINGNGLDNRRANLRPCRHGDNIKNSKKRYGTSSRFKGVARVVRLRSRKRWNASIESDGIRIHLGDFETEIEAARQYDRAARLLHRNFARTNEMMGLLPPC